jgi:hypothetical protein
MLLEIAVGDAEIFVELCIIWCEVRYWRSQLPGMPGM